MCQISNLLHRSAVPMDPQTNMKAAEDFLLLLLHAHTVAAAKELLSYQLTEAEPPSFHLWLNLLLILTCCFLNHPLKMKKN